MEDRRLLSVLVTSWNDSGPGTLRQAIIDAPPGETIEFASSLRGKTIALTGGWLELSRSITIQGPGAAQLTIDGKNNSKPGYYQDGVFKVDSGVNVTISGLTVANAFTMEGGGIYNNVTVATSAGRSGGSAGRTVGVSPRG